MITASIDRRRSDARSRRCAIILAVVVGWLSTTAIVADEKASIRVRYRSVDTVYLDAGSRAGLAVGDRLLITRRDETIAEVEITYVAGSSASCRVLGTQGEIQEGDLAVLSASSPREPGLAEQPAEASSSDSPSSLDSRLTPADGGPATAADSGGYAPERVRPKASGSVVLDWEGLSSDESDGLGYTRTGVRLDLRIRDLAGGPYEFRARMRRREYDRDRLLAGLPSETETRDRFYELSLAYEPPDGRYSYALGRLGGSSSVLGYLDGVVGRVAAGSSFVLGGLVGVQPDLDEVSFIASELKYGLFAEYRALQDDGSRSWDALVGVIREEGELDVSREYVGLRTRFDRGGRWSLYQRAEVDLNNGWRREFESSPLQLSAFSLGATGRFSDALRVTVSYDRYERYRTEQTRSLSRELFDDLLRYGLRGRLSYGRPRSLNVAVFAGFRDRDDNLGETVSFGVGLSDSQVTRWNMNVAANVLGFENPFTEGWVATLRTGMRFPGGHEMDLTLGSRLSTDFAFAEDLSTSWFRVGGWVELPARLFATMSYELTTGDEVEDELASFGLGYRF